MNAQWRHVENTVNQWRATPSCVIEPAQLARALGVQVVRRRLVGDQWGLTLPGTDRVVVSSELSEERQRFTIGHELGHVLIFRGGFPHFEGNIETACDVFARELVMPTALVDRAASPEVLACEFRVEVRLAAAKLAMLGALTSPRVAHGTVICCECGDNWNSASCDCSRLRRRISALDCAS